MDTIQTYSKTKLDKVGAMTGFMDYPSIVEFLCREFLDTFGYSNVFPANEMGDNEEPIEDDENAPAYIEREEVEL